MNFRGTAEIVDGGIRVDGLVLPVEYRVQTGWREE